VPHREEREEREELRERTLTGESLLHERVRKMSKGAQLTIGASLIFALLSWYGYTNLEAGSTFQYYQTLDEFIAQSNRDESMVGRSLRIHGYVAPGTIDRNLEAKHVTFAVQNDPPHKQPNARTTLSILFRSLETPDLFQDGADVVVEGELVMESGEMVFVADNVLAKCPSKFEANAEVPPEGSTSL
jgi:cytochrome c-type biogenesis protein CcmE